jgi:3'(2'), 5'-bisphosphate nucleotidase
MTTHDLADDHRLARRLADESGELLLRLRADVGATGDADALRHEGDRASHVLLTTRLAAERPADAVLSEEGADDGRRLESDRVWIVDPLDGTREFGELDRVDWAVHVALWERGRIVAAAVARPAMGSTLATDQPPVVAPAAAAGSPLRLAVSRTRPPAFVTELADALGAELVPMGSAGIKAMSVIDGVVDAYVHAGGQYEWDSAAPVGVARACGLHTSRVDGSPLHYNQAQALLPDLVICRPEVATQILESISDLTLEGAQP